MTKEYADWAPVHIHGGDRDSRWLITCDHATNTVPYMVSDGDLGISDGDMTRHIAYDVGAAGVATALADALGAPAVLSNFSRLVIDPNRGADDPTVLMKLYDGTVIPANRHADDAEKARRIALMHAPYHAEIDRLADRRPDTVIVAIHSFTPQLRGAAPRPWHVGVLHAPQKAALSLALLDLLKAEPDLCVGDNQPYSGHLDGDSIDQHALGPGRLNTLIELRNDLITTPEAQSQWAARLAPLLCDALARAEGTAPSAEGVALQTKVEIEAAAFRRLQMHLMETRRDVQNIDLMDLGGFCRNCLARWMQEAAAERGVVWSKDEARDAFYGMPYEVWKRDYQT